MSYVERKEDMFLGATEGEEGTRYSLTGRTEVKGREKGGPVILPEGRIL